MPEFENSDEDEEDPMFVVQPLPLGVIKQPLPLTTSQKVSASAKNEITNLSSSKSIPNDTTKMFQNNNTFDDKKHISEVQLFEALDNLTPRDEMLQTKTTNTNNNINNNNNVTPLLSSKKQQQQNKSATPSIKSQQDFSPIQPSSLEESKKKNLKMM